MIETDDGGHLCDVSTVSTGFSDHCLLKARLNCGHERTLVTIYSYRDIKNMDLDSFRASLRSSVSSTNTPTDPDDIVVQLEDDLHSAVETYAPLRSKRRRVGRSRFPWLTPECITAKRKRRRLERRLKRTRSKSDCLAYRRSCRETSRLFREARSAYTRDTL